MPREYKVRASRREDGDYDLSYGKGQKKLIAVLTGQAGKWWVLPDGDKVNLKRDAIAEWGQWAASAYGGTTSHSETNLADEQQADVSAGAALSSMTDELSFNDAFVRLSQKQYRDRMTASQKHDLKLLLQSILGDEQRAAPLPPVYKNPPLVVRLTAQEAADIDADMVNLPKVSKGPPVYVPTEDVGGDEHDPIPTQETTDEQA